jgi:hypothetical protein
MSRYYNMSVTIKGDDPERTEEIKAAADEEWGFEEWLTHNEALFASSDGSLCGGETEEEFAERISKAIWQANGSFCDVTVNATYMEELPCESYSLDEKDYHRLVTNESEDLHAGS